MTKDIFDMAGNSQKKSIEELMEEAKATSREMMGVSAQRNPTPVQETRQAMREVYGNPSDAFSRDEAGKITLNKKPSALTGSEATNLMAAIRSSVHAKYGVES